MDETSDGAEPAIEWETAVPPRPPESWPPPPGAAPGPLPPYVESGPRRPRRRGLIAIGALGVLAAGTFAVVSLGSADGAGSPEAAVEELFDAVEQEDVIGVLEALAPGERRVLVRPIQNVAFELQRLGILSADLDLGSVGGIDFEIDGLTLSATELAEGIDAVRITGGTITTRTIPDRVPVGPVLRDVFDEFDEDLEGDRETTTDSMVEDEPFDIVAVEEGGGWHVSLGYTIAEAARADGDLDPPPFGHGVQPVGAASPEEAVRGLVLAAADLDLERVIAGLPPGEMGVLHDYAPLFLPDVEEAAEEARADGVMVEIDELDLEEEGDGDVRRVVPTGFVVSGSTGDGDFRVTFDGACFTFDLPDDEEEEILGMLGDTDGELCEDDLADFGSAGLFGGTFTPTGIVTVREDGQWYVSPIGTIADSLLVTLRQFERRDFEDGLFEGLFGPFFGTTSSEKDFDKYDFDDEPFDDEPFGDEGDEGDEGDDTFDPSEVLPPETPTGLGTDPELDALAELCFAGDMGACDDLYLQSDFDSEYEEYGNTCGGRRPDNFDYCEDLPPDGH